MAASTAVRLPAGRLDGHRDAVLRPMDGTDEEWFHGLPPETPEARVVTQLLARCVASIGPSVPDVDAIRDLPTGDREWLVVQLWRLSFGERVELVLTCPRPSCGSRMDVDFTLDGLSVDAQPQQPEYTVAGVSFRLPRGADLEALSDVDGDPADALLRRCALGDSLSFADGLELHSPGVEHGFAAGCPACGAEFVTDFDPVLSFLTEVVRRRAEFETDVHLLGWYYHWPPSEILAMSRPRRRRYVALLRERLERAEAGR